ncbi:hypothetical protein K3495_g5238 [Podosphaera aphanis]|nr:hypothetical protein K3495_g5238 [Podosphaera aphanis]
MTANEGCLYASHAEGAAALEKIDDMFTMMRAKHTVSVRDLPFMPSDVINNVILRSHTSATGGKR